MKLIKRTYLHTAFWLFPVLVIGSIFCFFMIEYIAYEETDEFLTYEMERLVKYHKEYNELPEYHKVANIIPDVKYEKPFFKDTLILEPGDNEMVPYRELYFSINHKGRDFGIVLHHLLLGRDDIAQGTLLIIVGLMLLTALCIFLILNQVTEKIWKPFYKTLDKLINFKIDNTLPEFPNTNIDEFESLNTTLQVLLNKIIDDYKNNKQFNENASHELQTHLAIIRANTEKLLNDEIKDEQGLSELKKIYTAATRLSQVQKSLLLLSKINNREFNNNADIDLQKLLKQALDTFQEVIEIRNINIHEELNNCTVFIDSGLAEILINNLIKNAVKHNIQNGYIKIKLNCSSFIIENSGLPYNGDPKVLLERFARGKDGNLGIGLSIVKQICEIYSFSISYKITNQSNHILSITF